MIVRTKRGNFTLAWIDHLSLSVLDKTVDVDEWNEMLELAKVHAPMPARVALLVTRDATITAEHRRRTAEFTAGTPPLKAVALATSSTITRGALVAFGWLNKGMTQYKTFSLQQLDQALEWLATIDPFDCRAARALLDQMMAPEPG